MESMQRDAAEVLKDALALEPEVRGALIDSLIGSLDQTVDPAAEEEWREEIRRRLHQIDREAVELLPWDKARSRLRFVAQSVSRAPTRIHPAALEEAEAAVEWYRQRSVRGDGNVPGRARSCDRKDGRSSRTVPGPRFWHTQDRAS